MTVAFATDAIGQLGRDFVAVTFGRPNRDDAVFDETGEDWFEYELDQVLLWSNVEHSEEPVSAELCPCYLTAQDFVINWLLSSSDFYPSFDYNFDFSDSFLKLYASFNIILYYFLK